MRRVRTSTWLGSMVECGGHEQNVVERQRERDVGGRVGHAFTPTGAPWHFLYFFPLPQGHGSLRPTFGSSRCTVLTALRRPAAAAST